MNDLHVWFCRAEAWLKSIRRSDLVVHKLENHRICSKHFTNSMYNCPHRIQSSHLLDSAIPTLNLPSDGDAILESHPLVREVSCQAGGLNEATKDASTTMSGTAVAKKHCSTQTSGSHTSWHAKNQVPILRKKIVALQSRLRGHKFRRSKRMSSKSLKWMREKLAMGEMQERYSRF